MAATTRTTTCLHCSLCCPAGVAVDEYGLVTPEYPGHTAEAHHGLCARGHFIGELLGHPGRIREVMERGDGGLRAVPLDEARGRSALARGSAEGLAAVIDGNLPCEEIARAVHVARTGLGVDRVAIFIPPADEAVLRGLAASAAPRVAKEALADCDVLLAVGDPFATHPLVASPMLDAIAKARANRLVVIDAMRGRTAEYAAEVCQVRPGGEAAALAGVLVAMGAAERLPEACRCEVGEAAAMAGVDAAVLEALARSLSGAERLGVVIALPAGRCAAATAAGALAGQVAEAKGGSLCPLLTYGNAVGAWRVAAGLEALTPSDLMADIRGGRINRLVAVGTDVVSALPLAELGSVEIVAAASALPSPTTARAQMVLPLALSFELGGTVVDGAGARGRVDAAAAPPRGALAPAEALAALAAAVEPMPELDLDAMLGAEPSADLAEALGDSGGWAPAPGEGTLTVVSRADALGFADGSLSRQLTWPAMMEPRPTVTLNPADAGPGGVAVLRSNGVALGLPIVADEAVPQGVGAVSPHFPETRTLFAWAARGVGPGHVTMEAARGND